MNMDDLPPPAHERLPKELVEKRHKDKRWYGFEHPPGWDDLVIELDEKLNEIVPDYQIHQAKEKFGMLRFYISAPNLEVADGLWKKVYRLIGEYENKSGKICQNCGEEGRLRDDRYWLVTLCDNCHEEDLKRQQKEDNE